MCLWGLLCVVFVRCSLCAAGCLWFVVLFACSLLGVCCLLPVAGICLYIFCCLLIAVCV